MKITLKEIFTTKWKNLFIINLVIIFLFGLIGSSIPLNPQQTTEILDQLENILPENISEKTIFINNYKIALLMMIPFIGLIFGSLVIFQTGTAFGAAASTVGTHGIIFYLLTALTPFFWLEFIAYSASMTQGIFILNSLRNKSIKNESIRTLLVIIINFTLLLVGAFVEMLFI
jgi:hypothetical protein